MNVGIGTEAALFPEKEFIMDIACAVYVLAGRAYSTDRNRGREEPNHTAARKPSPL